jgi:hypothetical protein
MERIAMSQPPIPASAPALIFTYCHPFKTIEGKYLSAANILWGERDRGDAYYRVSKYAMRAGKFPPSHPCPGDGSSTKRGEMGTGEGIMKFRERGYWASCFPEGDGITLKWWDGPESPDKTAEQVMQDIRECFGWKVRLRK